MTPTLATTKQPVINSMKSFEEVRQEQALADRIKTFIKTGEPALFHLNISHVV
jgi:hypothetical protein